MFFQIEDIFSTLKGRIPTGVWISPHGSHVTPPFHTLVGTSDDQHLAPPTGAVTSDEGYNLFQPSRIIELPFPSVHLRSQEQSHVNAVSSTVTGQASTSVHSRHDDQRMGATSDRMAENLNFRSRMYNLAGLALTQRRRWTASETHAEAKVNPASESHTRGDGGPARVQKGEGGPGE